MEELSQYYCTAQDRQLKRTVSQIRESLSLQELERIELKEIVLSSLLPTEPYQHLNVQLSLIKPELITYLLELRVTPAVKSSNKTETI